MNLAIAIKISDAACGIGRGLLGQSTEVDLSHIDIIRSISLAQMETAADTVTAENITIISAADNRQVFTVCNDTDLLSKVKRWSDAVHI
jgi:hypothetical protein